MRNYDECKSADYAVCCEPVKEPSIQDWLTAIKERLGETYATLENTLSALRGSGAEKCCGDAPRPVGCVMEDLDLTAAMSERVLKLALEVARPFQG